MSFHIVDINRIQTAILETIDKIHTEERELMMELINMAQQNKSLSKLTETMSTEASLRYILQ